MFSINVCEMLSVNSNLRHVFLRLQQIAPDITYVHPRSNNANCYHTGEALLSVEQLFQDRHMDQIH